MKKKFYSLICAFVIPAIALTQTIHYPEEIPYACLGTYSRNFIGAFSFTCNQSVLSAQKNISIGLYGERRFGLQELNFFSFAMSSHALSGGIGIQMNYFGFADYNESKFGIAYGRKLGGMVDIGIQFDYNIFHVAGYGNANTLNGEIGFMIHPTDKINVGLHVYNPVGGAIGKTGDRLPSIFRFGVGYESSQQVCTHVEIIKEENIPVYVNAGLQYVFAKQFFAGIGIETYTAAPYGSIGLHWKNFRIDIAAAYHLTLGFTPALVLVLRNNNKEE